MKTKSIQNALNKAVNNESISTCIELDLLPNLTYFFNHLVLPRFKILKLFESKKKKKACLRKSKRKLEEKIQRKYSKSSTWEPSRFMTNT